MSQAERFRFKAAVGWGLPTRGPCAPTTKRPTTKRSWPSFRC